MKVEVKNINKNIGDNVILSNVSFSLDKGKVLAVIGPSGAGKSTLLRCIAGLEKFSSGSVKPEIKKIGMVFQEFNLFSNKKVIDNITLAPMLVDGLSKQEAYTMAVGLLKKVKLEDKANVYPSELSGGQKQRIAIARALARNPEVLLFDEPTSALDPELTSEVLEIIKDLAYSKSLTVIIVTHEINFAKKIADKIIFLENGSKIYDGNPQFVLSQRRVRNFIERIN